VWQGRRNAHYKHAVRTMEEETVGLLSVNGSYCILQEQEKEPEGCAPNWSKHSLD